MNKKEQAQLLQARSLMIIKIKADKQSIKSMENSAENTKQVIYKLKIDLKDTKMEQLKVEINQRLESLTKSIDTILVEIEKTKKELKITEEEFNKIVKEIEKQDMILAGEWADDYEEKKEEKDKLKKSLT